MLLIIIFAAIGSNIDAIDINMVVIDINIDAIDINNCCYW